MAGSIFNLIFRGEFLFTFQHILMQNPQFIINNELQKQTQDGGLFETLKLFQIFYTTCAQETENTTLSSYKLTWLL
jgi:hypothetical protein